MSNSKPKTPDAPPQTVFDSEVKIPKHDISPIREKDMIGHSRQPNASMMTIDNDGREAANVTPLEMCTLPSRLPPSQSNKIQINTFQKGKNISDVDRAKRSRASTPDKSPQMMSKEVDKKPSKLVSVLPANEFGDAFKSVTK